VIISPVTVSRDITGRDKWAIGQSCLEHNHAPNPDPFQYIQHRSKKPGYTEAVTIAATHSGIISYTQSADILRKDGLEIDRKMYYSLHRKEKTGDLTKQEELQLLLGDLEQEGLHPRVRSEYILDEHGLPTQRVI
jgi:hypothetical protein